MLLHRRDQGLDDKDVALPALALELYAQAIVRITLYLRRQQRNAKVGTDFRRQQRVRSTTEDSDFTQRLKPEGIALQATNTCRTTLKHRSPSAHNTGLHAVGKPQVQAA
jgi:hypothetical protein